MYTFSYWCVFWRRALTNALGIENTKELIRWPHYFLM